MFGALRDVATLASLRRLAIVAVLVVFALVGADPTPSFLGIAPDTESPTKATLPAGSAPPAPAGDYSLPHVSKPPEAVGRVGACSAPAPGGLFVAFADDRALVAPARRGDFILRSSRIEFPPLRC